jgi:hypothetical protein
MYNKWLIHEIANANICTISRILWRKFLIPSTTLSSNDWLDITRFQDFKFSAHSNPCKMISHGYLSFTCFPISYSLTPTLITHYGVQWMAIVDGFLCWIRREISELCLVNNLFFPCTYYHLRGYLIFRSCSCFAVAGDNAFPFHSAYGMNHEWVYYWSFSC